MGLLQRRLGVEGKLYWKDTLRTMVISCKVIENRGEVLDLHWYHGCLES